MNLLSLTAVELGKKIKATFIVAVPILIPPS